MSRTSEARNVLKCEGCHKTLAKNGGIKCPRCGKIRPFPITEKGRVVDVQHTDVSLCVDINMIHDGEEFRIRLPRYNFHFSIEGDGSENPDLVTIRALLKSHKVDFVEAGGAVVNFVIQTAKNPVTMWVDARSHGFRMKDGEGHTLEVSVENQEIVFSTTRKVEKAITVNNVVVAMTGDKAIG